MASRIKIMKDAIQKLLPLLNRIKRADEKAWTDSLARSAETLRRRRIAALYARALKKRSLV